MNRENEINMEICVWITLHTGKNLGGNILEVTEQKCEQEHHHVACLVLLHNTFIFV